MFRYSFSSTGKMPKGRHMGKADYRFEKGLFLGKHYQTNEFLFGTKHGVYPSRTVKRLPKGGQVDKDMLENLVGVPWDTQGEWKPGRKKKMVTFGDLPVTEAPKMLKSEERSGSRCSCGGGDPSGAPHGGGC